MSDTRNEDERDKFDHSNHPTYRTLDSDMKAPGGGQLEHVAERDAAPTVAKKTPRRVGRTRPG